MNYSRYYLSGKEWARIIVEYLVIDIAFSYLFYDSLPAFVVGLMGIFPYILYRKKGLSTKRKDVLREQFLELIGVVSGKMRGGMSCENAMVDSISDMEGMYGRGSLICKELKLIEMRLNHQESLSVILKDLGKRSGVEDIYEFAEVFSIARAGSGKMRAVIEDTSVMMREKNETESEIYVLISGKRLEQRIMCIIPLVIMIYLKLQAGDFINVLYHNALGITVMSACLIVYIISYLMAEKVVNIEV